MGGHHSHARIAGTDDGATPFVAGRRVVVVLLAVLLPLLLATGVGLGVLWPRGHPKAIAATTTAAANAPVLAAKVRSVSATTCQGDSSDRLPDGTIPATTLCATAVVVIKAGPDQGKIIKVAVPPQVYQDGISPGDGIGLNRFPAQNARDAAAVRASDPNALPNGTTYAWVDFSRGLPLSVLAVIFALLVVAVARLRGLAALFGLAVGYLTVIKFMLPALRLGENAIAVAVVGSIAAMTALLYLAHGISTKTTTALLGTIFGLGLSGGITAWACAAVHLNGLSDETNYRLSQLIGATELSSIIACGIVVATLGVLNDVTITQASAVWEIHATAPHLGARALFASGMRVGRDHLASTVYTLAFAYAGAALPILVTIDLYQRPLVQILTSGQIAEEIVRTMVGSIGLILAIPVTTLIAALVVTSSRPRGSRGTRSRADHQPADGQPVASSRVITTPVSP